MFDGASVKHLQHAHSNHCPLLLQLEERTELRCCKRPFRFPTSWMLHDDFKYLVEKEWRWKGDLPKTLKYLAEKLQAWNHDTFRSIFKKREEVSLD